MIMPAIMHRLGLMFLAGLLVLHFMRRLPVLSISIYLVSGIVMAPLFSGFPESLLFDVYKTITLCAVSLVAFVVGQSLIRENRFLLKEELFAAALLQYILCFFSVILASRILFMLNWPEALILAMSASAGSTAVYIASVKGREQSESALEVSVFSDIIGLLVFAAIFLIIRSVPQNFAFGALSLISLGAVAIIKITVSLGLGTLLGMLSVMIYPKLKSEGEILIFTVLIILLMTGFSLGAGLSVIACVLGCSRIISAKYEQGYIVYGILDNIKSQIYIICFFLSGVIMRIHFSDRIIVFAAVLLLIRILSRSGSLAVFSYAMRRDRSIVPGWRYMVSFNGLAIPIAALSYLMPGTDHAALLGITAVAVIITDILLQLDAYLNGSASSVLPHEDYFVE
jgi:Kef-type K+ transport system membrane component KefB